MIIQVSRRSKTGDGSAKVNMENAVARYDWSRRMKRSVKERMRRYERLSQVVDSGLF